MGYIIKNGIEYGTGGGGTSPAAIDHTYSNTKSGLVAENVQDAIDEECGLITADNGKKFQFAYDGEKDQYGFMIDGNFVGFSNAAALYEALKYSGIVTEDMSYDEMIDALTDAYPELPAVLFQNGLNPAAPVKNFIGGEHGSGTDSANTFSVGQTIQMNIPYSSGGDTWMTIHSDEPINLAKYTCVRVKGDTLVTSTNGANDTTVVSFNFANEPITTKSPASVGNTFLIPNVTTSASKFDKIFDLPDNDGIKKYLCIGSAGQNDSRSYMGRRINVSDITFGKFEGDIYYNGYTCTKITGGWGAYAIAPTGVATNATKKLPVLTFGDTYVQIGFSGTSTSVDTYGLMAHNSPIDFTNVKSVTITISTNGDPSGNMYSGCVVDKLMTGYNTIKSSAIAAGSGVIQTINLDTTDVIGDAYVGIGCSAFKSTASRNMRITSIKLNY